MISLNYYLINCFLSSHFRHSLSISIRKTFCDHSCLRL